MPYSAALSSPAYDRLRHRFERLGRLRSLEGLLLWDSYALMPRGSAAARGEQLALVTTLMHETLSAPDMAEDLTEAEQAGLEGWDAENLRLMRREHLHATAVPAKLSGQIASAGARTEALWRQARSENNFSMVEDDLRELVELTREAASLKADALKLNTPSARHDALMDAWDPGITDQKLSTLFDALECPLREKIQACLDRQAAAPKPVPMPLDQQRGLSNHVADWMGFDSQDGVMAESAQPNFMDDNPEDVRITTRFNETDFRIGVLGITHEIGHFHYERGMPKAWLYQPIGRPASAGMQESQSILFEKHVARSDGFLTWLAAQVEGLDGATLKRSLHHIQPSACRVDADEVTYPLHILIRHRLERDLIEGDLAVRDLPEAWNAAYKQTLGIVPADDQEGCLQDIHWYRGLFGYFQSYCLGTLAAAQIREAAEAHVSLDDVSSLLDWLSKTVFRQGRRYGMDALMQQVSGRPLGVDAFLDHVDQHYLKPLEQAA